MSTIISFIIFMKFAMVLFIMVDVLKKYLLDIFELCFPQCLKQHVFFQLINAFQYDQQFRICLNFPFIFHVLIIVLFSFS